MDPAVIGLRRAGGDPTAVGQPAVRSGQAIGITFLRVTGGRVSGRLDPYTDPDCNCPLYTTFEGALKADTLQGTYSSHHDTGGYTPHGGWRVVRNKACPPTAPPLALAAPASPRRPRRPPPGRRQCAPRD